ncbi:TPA_asm: hypothetical protein [Porphyromonas phage phage017a_JCVISC001]|uniref:Uncharacterized protein n=1 Tax=Porphyromonas phage phage017a_JCVISC001 TaxID=3154107 RepID=A0AAT9JBM6_9CAUD
MKWLLLGFRVDVHLQWLVKHTKRKMERPYSLICESCWIYFTRVKDIICEK